MSGKRRTRHNPKQIVENLDAGRLLNAGQSLWPQGLAAGHCLPDQQLLRREGIRYGLMKKIFQLSGRFSRRVEAVER